MAVVDGKYTLTLKHPLYKGPMMLVVRDNTPGGADNYIDEGSLQLTDLGPTPLRALVMASGVNQNVNVTALTELAVLKAGLDQGVTSESKGQTTSVQNLTLGYYWVAQKLENAKGGPGDDEILVGTTKDRQATVIETGSGRDTVTVGKFGTAATNLEATISDFQLEMDKVKVFLRDGGHKMNYQNITSANWQQFAPRAEQSAFGSGTKLVIDLDGAGAGTDKYILYLPTVAFNYDTNTKSLFGL
ncbi:hypothetical protein J2X56_003233 [Herbaspirillum sp. 1173]|uniref:M10 family metallopeptidase C-terminal domain-containing protein n=1 Tax=Herbaspirillum sp. 1173 TaxID=2817734 RepID=UPI002854CBB0|nr:hypothetical protein [Herbaspirillum sp. 1173]MDR6741209.1 hypothetical protein [Herbaspirillum sp. 1173]